MTVKTAWCLWFACSVGGFAQATDPPAAAGGHGKPAIIATVDLVEFDTLPLDRRILIGKSIAVARDSPWLKYTSRGSKPADGGFDCSGAMHFVMREAGLDPPRSAAAQLQWLKRHDRFHEVPPVALTLQHPSLAALKPGDLLFWGHPGSTAEGNEWVVTHVAMFLGNEKTDRRPVMINSTDGRSYRGKKANGYGVYDFRLPLEGSRISFLGYGSPPGIAAMPKR
jgi:cell wall-associated NlpC family hydrolase